MTSAAHNARVIPAAAYTDPEVAWVGLTEDQAKAQGIKVKSDCSRGMLLGVPLSMVADAIDIGKTIHPHQRLGEFIGVAADVAHGSCTYLPPARQ